MHIDLKRIYLPDHTAGIISLGDIQLPTLELPWRDNQRNISCIAEGTYEWVQHDSPKFGECIKLNNVINRTHILIHAGNTVDHTKGCILPGCSYGSSSVRNSRAALKSIREALPDQGTITIKGI